MGPPDGKMSGGGWKRRSDRRRGVRAGFTLLELSIVAAIVALLGATLAAALHGGIRIWENTHTSNGQAVAAAIAYEFWTRDVRNSIPGDTVSVGKDDTMSLNVLLANDATNDMLLPGRVEYVFDREKLQLRRSSSELGGGVFARRNDEVMLGGVYDAKFEFIFRCPDGTRTGWRAIRDTKDRLIAARLTVWMKADGDTAPLSRTAYCMAAFATNAP